MLRFLDKNRSVALILLKPSLMIQRPAFQSPYFCNLLGHLPLRVEPPVELLPALVGPVGTPLPVMRRLVEVIIPFLKYLLFAYAQGVRDR